MSISSPRLPAWMHTPPAPAASSHKPASRLALTLAALAVLAPSQVRGQAATETRLDRQLARVDVAVSATALLNSTTNGTNLEGQAVSDSPGNTVGALATVRYTARPYVGFEGNFSYARFTQKFNTPTALNPDEGVQANTQEYSLGYVAHPPDIFSVHPFIAIGAGVNAYKPTPGGGQGLSEQARALYYYAFGAEGLLTRHFGVRAQFRQTLSLAPDFGQNYLTIKQRTISSQPAFGFFVHF